MPDTKISELASQTGAALAIGHLFVTVDISDTTMAASGTDKSLTLPQVLLGLFASPSFTGTVTGAGPTVLYGTAPATQTTNYDIVDVANGIAVTNNGSGLI